MEVPDSIARLLAELERPEPEARHIVASFAGLIDPAVGIIRAFERERHGLGDEPDFICYRADLAPTAGLSDGGYVDHAAEGGRGSTDDEAIVGAIFEGLERYCLSFYKRRDLVTASFDTLCRDGPAALDPAELVSWERARRPEQRAQVRQAVLSWTRGLSYRHGREILVPAQLVYVPYRFGAGEPLLRDPLTTGAAAGLARGQTILRGLLEVIERDVTTIIHYRSLALPRLDPRRCPDASLRSMLAQLQRCQLDVTLYDGALDHPIPVVVAKIEDGTGVGPAVTVASKASFDASHAARGAVLEAACFRSAMRSRMVEARDKAERLLSGHAEVDSSEQRGHLAVHPRMRERLAYLDGSSAVSDELARSGGAWGERVRALLAATFEAGRDIIVVDVTTSEVRALGVTVVKVVVPGLQPMHLREPDRIFTARLLGYGRATPVGLDELNQTPHLYL